MAQNITQTTMLSTSSTKLKESTSPRKRKNFLDKLKSNLSSKYIGEIENLGNSESQRKLRRHKSGKENAIKEDMPTKPLSPDSTLDFIIDEELVSNQNDYNVIRRTDISIENIMNEHNTIISPAHVAQKHACRKVYISPIDKLLISNGSTAPIMNDGAKTPDVSWFQADLKNPDYSDCESSTGSSKPKEDSGNCEKSDSDNNAAPNILKIESFESINDQCGENIDRAEALEQVALSPSILSLDSAQGSSVVNSECIVAPPFAAGDICWGQIFTYCYWPCIVCPDPEGKTISTIGARNRERHVVVHVRFFADQGRRNWVKRENLMAYHGLEAYKRWTREIRERFGSKHSKCKFLMPTLAKLQSWQHAIGEANKVVVVPSEKRLHTFHDLQTETTKLLKQQKLQNAKRLPAKILSVDNVMIKYEQTAEEKKITEHEYNNEEWEANLSSGGKRMRSESPMCPPYSPIKPAPKKLRQISNSDLVNNSPNNSIDITNNAIDNNASNKEFRKFYAVMRNFVMENNTDENLEKSLAVAVSNIWSLKQINQAHQQQHLLNSLDETPKLGSETTAVKRLSNRLKYLSLPHTLSNTIGISNMTTKTSTPNSTSNNAMEMKDNAAEDQEIKEPKVKKPLNRPIEEVIDDILHLDNKYLFKGMSRENVCKYCCRPGGDMVRCAQLNCQTFFHAICLRNPLSADVIYANPNDNQFSKNNRKRNRASRKNMSAAALPPINNFEIKHQTADSVMDEKYEGAADIERKSQSASLNILCKDCENNEPAKCYVCKNVQKFNDDGEEQELLKCNLPQCNGYYHELCCKYWPQAKFVKSKNLMEYVRCPSHVCHTCVSDDPKGKFQHLSNSKLTRCIKCPATYHTDSTCIPAGSIILTAAFIICPRHHVATKSDQHVNVSWCFICVGGGQVLCCETCPTAVHADCMKINTPTGAYICEECESGRMPLYGELVWAKFNSFRWWPALILPPTEVPSNILRRAHNPHEFVVRFFGTHDHGWISRRRVYLFVEGDCGEPPRSKTSNLDKNYVRGVIEAKRIYELMQQRKQVLRLQLGDAMEKGKSLQPQPFIKIKNNKPVAPLKLRPLDIEHVNKCECDPNDDEPCGPDANCLNRVLYHECNPKICAAGARCLNQLFESRISPRLEVVYMKERGFGLVCREPIDAGTFIIEYVGEVINDTEFNERLAQKFRDRDENFYFLSLEKDHIIDAGPKGNLARFMNHSCDPNCETQKWSVNCNNRVGIFAIKDIPENSELTFNYLWDDLMGNEKKPCYCGASGCTGQIGAKSKDDKAKIGIETTKLHLKRRKEQHSFLKINPKPLTSSSSANKKKIIQNPNNEKQIDTKIVNNLLQ